MLLRSPDLSLLVSLNALSLALDSEQRANARNLRVLLTLNHKLTELSDFVIASNHHHGTPALAASGQEALAAAYAWRRAPSGAMG
jgi:hypothetical protein